jgi:hypothetical protein
MVNLTVFHHHLLTGGVSTVILRGLRALRAHLPGLGELRLVAGRIPQAVREEARKLPAAVSQIPAVDYLSAQPAEGRPEQPGAAELAARLVAELGSPPSVWWIHNYHVGKNPVFTEALLRIAREHPAQRMILQIHDFPESGRHQNLRRLRETLTLPAYPLAPEVRYAVLTRRDREVLLGAGLPPAAVHVLENPVALGPGAPPPGRGRRVPTRKRLGRLFGARFPAFQPSLPVLLYPVRTIRRKNALEAMLLASLLARPVNLLITLPGVSAAEKPYSDRVAALFAEGLCRGLWGIGESLPAAGLGFMDLVGAADLVLCTSVQEGFGYLFVDALRWRLPLAARRLAPAAELQPLFRGYPVELYDHIPCPLRRQERQTLRSAYRRKLLALRDLYPRQDRRRLERELEDVLGQEAVDFSYLSMELQEHTLREVARDAGRRAAVAAANSGLLGALEALLGAETPDRAQALEERFGARAYASAFGRILRSFGGDPAPPEAEQWRTQAGVLRAFARAERMRLLLGA